MAEEIKMGIYRHYKGNEYRVLYTAINSETKEEMVIYQDIADENKIWVRPKQMFSEEVGVDGKKKPRFEFISENEVAETLEDKKSFEDKYKRALADYQNLLKQTAKEKMEFAIYANEQMIKEILPVYGHLKMAIEHGSGESSNGWLEGVKHVVKQFEDVLNKFGVSEIEVKDKPFDHNNMEAISNEETADKKLDGKVAKLMKAGYTLNGRVIEAAKVVVYKMKN